MAQTRTRRAGATTSLNATFLTKRVGREWTALCLEYDLASCGETEDDAMRSLRGLLELYIADYLEEGAAEIPRRPVPPAALREFLSPPDSVPAVRVTSHRETFPVRNAVA